MMISYSTISFFITVSDKIGSIQCLVPILFVSSISPSRHNSRTPCSLLLGIRLKHSHWILVEPPALPDYIGILLISRFLKTKVVSSININYKDKNYIYSHSTKTMLYLIDLSVKERKSHYMNIKISLYLCNEQQN